MLSTAELIGCSKELKHPLSQDPPGPPLHTLVSPVPSSVSAVAKPVFPHVAPTSAPRPHCVVSDASASSAAPRHHGCWAMAPHRLSPQHSPSHPFPAPRHTLPQQLGPPTAFLGREALVNVLSWWEPWRAGPQRPVCGGLLAEHFLPCWLGTPLGVGTLSSGLTPGGSPVSPTSPYLPTPFSFSSVCCAFLALL